MIDINIIREQPERLDEALKKRGAQPQAAVLASIDLQRRVAQNGQQELQAKRNDLSRQVGELKKKGENADALMAEVAALKDKLEQLTQTEATQAQALEEKLSYIPNIPADDVPFGRDENDNVEVRRFLEPSRINSSKEHHELGGALGMMSSEIAAKMSGARFTWLERDLARLERAIGQFMLDLHVDEHGYDEVSPPLMVRAQAMYGTGQFPKFREDAFATSEDRYLIPTAEVPLTNLVAGEIVDASQLPIRLTALTPSFREEAGSAGRDTVGMLRQHQFYKVEMVSITTPDQSEEEHQRMVKCAEKVLELLEIPYRTVLLCTGDMGFASQKTYDIEAWLPGQNKYREISSCSNCGDFQARRMNARTRMAGQKSTQFVHTLNGSGVAVGRALIAVMENYQQPDGSVRVPDVLQPYMNDKKVIGLEKE